MARLDAAIAANTSANARALPDIALLRKVAGANEAHLVVGKACSI
jgi:hypothetical protein